MVMVIGDTEDLYEDGDDCDDFLLAFIMASASIEGLLELKACTTRDTQDL